MNAYESVKALVDELKSAGVTPDRVVVPSKDFDQIKRNADRTEDESGWPQTLVGGVEVTHKQSITQPQALVKYSGGGDA